MATEENLPLTASESEQATETGQSPTSSTASSHSGTSSGPLASPSNIVAARPWYQWLNEDWWALILGLTLVVLIIARVLHSIP
ncbi:hypothetical protein [Thermogemmatispora sp.]|uniref:hypothetical protein n=1 Tax=Thermogemmatispora sp. TaxID=1968838 RepID=UPI001D1D8C22|nr:hypothetical protein [Thermogemmatispora sp.]MBX5451289.1 hypothetical protein [Thermogemmatispora sp.]